MTDCLTVVSTDCHAGLPIAQYKPYVDSGHHDFIDMAVDIQIEMMDKAEQQFLIKEINDGGKCAHPAGVDWRRLQASQDAGEGRYCGRNYFPRWHHQKHTLRCRFGTVAKDAVPEPSGRRYGTQLLLSSCCQRSVRHRRCIDSALI